MNTLDMVMNYRSEFFPYIPYRTGRLAYTSMGDLYSPYGQNSVGFDFCRLEGVQYGIILNEANYIHYVRNGKQGSYLNKHFGYFDRFFDSYASKLAMLLGGELMQGEIL